MLKSLKTQKIRSFLIKYFIFFIILLALALRLFDLSSLPSGFHNDEASFLYNAVSLKDTGKDEDGRSFPPFLNSFIDPKPALYSYLQIPFISLFGNTVVASRLPGVIFGVVSIIFLYLIVKELVEKRLALLMAFLITISPWHIMVSRATQEVIMSFCFSLIAIYILLLILRKSSIKILHLGLLFLFSFLAMYSYHSAKIFLPVMLVFITLMKLKGQNIRLSIGIALVSAAAFILSFATGGTTRFQAVSIFTDQKVQLIMNEEIGKATAQLPPLAIRFFYNKVTAYGMAVADQYFQYLNGSFLFISGGEPDRYMIPFHGLFFHVEVLLLLIGLISVFRKIIHQDVVTIFIIWIIIAILPAALSVQESPSMIRSFPLIVPLLFFIAVGITTIWDSRRGLLRTTTLAIIGLGYLWGILYFLNQFMVQQPIYRPWNRYYAEQQMVEKVRELQKNYSKIVISKQGDSYIYFALDGLIPLSDLQSSYPKRKDKNYTFGQYTFIDFACSKLSSKKDTVFIVDVSCKVNEEKYEVTDKISYKDGAAKYQVVKRRPSSSNIMQPTISPSPSLIPPQQ